MERTFRIADFTFRVIAPDTVIPPENFMKFAVPVDSPACTYEIVLTDDFPLPRGALAARRHDLLVYRENGLEQRYLSYYAGTTQHPFACFQEESPDHTSIFLRPDVLNDLVYDTMFTSLFSLERRMIDRSALILHSSYIRYQDRAILFSAPSGTGKSTQAGLWERYRGVRQINGDRSLLRQIDGVWHACGWPVCGSSEICHNEDTPIRAIVMLSQSDGNEIRRLSPMHAFSQLYSQITVNRWSRSFQTRAMDLIEELIRDVPVYHLACTISREAVDCLDQALRTAEQR